MARTYGPLGPQGQNQDPSFLRSMALLALSRRAGPSGTSRPRGTLDYISNPLARERYARSMLDEQQRGMVAEREATQAGPDLARRGLGLQEQSLEEQIRAAFAGEGLQGREMDIRERLGQGGIGLQERGLGLQERGMENQYDLGLRGADLGERSLEEQIRASMAGEGLKRDEVDILRTTGGNPERAAQADALRQQTKASSLSALTQWAQQPSVLRRIGSLIKSGRVQDLVDLIRNNPLGVEVTVQDVSRLVNDLVLSDPDISSASEIIGRDLTDPLLQRLALEFQKVK